MNSKQISVLAAFLAAGVDFAVVGGIAVNVHGYMRATNDMDLFIRPTEDNARLAYEALQNLGAPVGSLEPNDLLDDEANFRFGSDEDHIDILASIGEMAFDQVWQNRVESRISGMNIPIISKADLVDNKRQVARLRDLADVEELTSLPDTDGLDAPA